MGSKKQSIASKNQWAKLSKEERLARMKPLMEGRKSAWLKLSAKKRKLHAKKMAEARWGKKKK